jgi:predicted NodU family carbamoyl transferase
MSDDFRVVVKLTETKHNQKLTSVLTEHEVEQDVRQCLGDRIAVSDDGDVVFLYADTEDAGREAQRIVNDLMRAHEMPGEVNLEPMPTTPEQHQQEHERLEQEETAESQASGLAEWEVRIELASHHDAHAFAQQLEQEGLANVVRRWRYLLIGTNDQDDAEALAKRL